ncbi:hypothetical protein ACFX15_033889 [Malus domestica]
MVDPASALNFEKAIVACPPGISDGDFSLFSRTKPPIVTFPNLKDFLRSAANSFLVRPVRPASDFSSEVDVSSGA